MSTNVRTSSKSSVGATCSWISRGMANQKPSGSIWVAWASSAWSRTPKKSPRVEFVELDELLTESDVISLHLLLNDETRGFVSRACIEAMKPGVILINTARGALVDEEAMIDALKSDHIRHAGLDVFNVEPLPVDHPLTKLPNVTLSAHSAFRTPEASENLIAAAWEHCRRIAKETR